LEDVSRDIQQTRMDVTKVRKNAMISMGMILRKKNE